MHTLIRVLAFAKDEEMALHEAHKVIQEKLKTSSKGGPFDYYVDFHDSSGISRWGPIPPVLQVSTARFPTEDPRGMDQVSGAFEFIKEAFKENMRNLRYHIANYTDDELFSEIPGKGRVEVDGQSFYDDPRGFKNVCQCLSGYTPDVFLFDFKGGAITNHYHLHRILTDSDKYPFYVDETNGQDPDWSEHMWKQPLWVVPFDVHF